MAVGDISDLIETPVGYDIIKITDFKENAVRAQRIYIAIKPSIESEKAAEEKVNSILTQLEGGADFVVLAGQYSDDPMAAEKGGDWKEISIDMMTPELKNAFDSFDEGTISRPVKTPLGIHIFKVVNRQGLTKDEIEQLRRFLSDQRLEEKLKEYSKKLKEKEYIERLAEN